MLRLGRHREFLPDRPADASGTARSPPADVAPPRGPAIRNVPPSRTFRCCAPRCRRRGQAAGPTGGALALAARRGSVLVRGLALTVLCLDAWPPHRAVDRARCPEDASG